MHPCFLSSLCSCVEIGNMYPCFLSSLCLLSSSSKLNSWHTNLNPERWQTGWCLAVTCMWPLKHNTIKLTSQNLTIKALLHVLFDLFWLTKSITISFFIPFSQCPFGLPKEDAPWYYPFKANQGRIHLSFFHMVIQCHSG